MKVITTNSRYELEWHIIWSTVTVVYSKTIITIYCIIKAFNVCSLLVRQINEGERHKSHRDFKANARPLFTLFDLNNNKIRVL